MEEQYYLSKYANISLDLSDKLVDFERKAFIGLVMKDLQRKQSVFNF